MVILSADPYIVGRTDVTDEPGKGEDDDEEIKNPYTISVEDWTVTDAYWTWWQ